MYVFVDISVDVRHLVSTVVANLPSGANLVLAGTIQFASSIQVKSFGLSDGKKSSATQMCPCYSQRLSSGWPASVEPHDPVAELLDGGALSGQWCRFRQLGACSLSRFVRVLLPFSLALTLTAPGSS